MSQLAQPKTFKGVTNKIFRGLNFRPSPANSGRIPRFFWLRQRTPYLVSLAWFELVQRKSIAFLTPILTVRTIGYTESGGIASYSPVTREDCCDLWFTNFVAWPNLPSIYMWMCPNWNQELRNNPSSFRSSLQLSEESPEGNFWSVRQSPRPYIPLSEPVRVFNTFLPRFISLEHVTLNSKLWQLTARQNNYVSL